MPDHFDSSAADFQQSPAWGQFLKPYQGGRRQIKAFAAHSFLGLLTEGLAAIREKIGAGKLALDQHGMVGALPADSVWHFSADAGLFGKHDSAAIGPQPAHGSFYELGVSHGFGVRFSSFGERKQEQFYRECRKCESDWVASPLRTSSGGRAGVLAGHDAALLGPLVTRGGTGVFIALITTGRSRTVSSKYRSAAAAWAVELSAINPSAAMIKASLGANFRALRSNPSLGRR